MGREMGFLELTVKLILQHTDLDVFRWVLEMIGMRIELKGYEIVDLVMEKIILAPQY